MTYIEQISEKLRQCGDREMISTLEVKDMLLDLYLAAQQEKGTDVADGTSLVRT